MEKGEGSRAIRRENSNFSKTSELMFIHRVCEILMRFAYRRKYKTLFAELEQIHSEMEHELRGDAI